MIYPKKPWFPPSCGVIWIPSSITEVEKRAVRDSAEQAGAEEVYLVYEPIAAALGIGIDIEDPVGNMIIDIGGMNGCYSNIPGRHNLRPEHTCFRR